MFDLWDAQNSTLREKALEHIFLSELAKALLLTMRTPFEVLRAEFDAHGYDVVIEARGIVRHVQLKATRIGGKRRDVDVNLALTSKPGGCVVWFMTEPTTLSIGPFFWLGGKPGHPMPAPEGPVTRHSRANADGVKGERKGLRRVPIRRFTKMDRIDQVAEAMFGPDHHRLLLDHLERKSIDPNALQFPDGFAWRNGIEFAHIIDGYELAEAAGLGDPFAYQAASRAAAVATGCWQGSTLELWVKLFLEYRRLKFDGPVGMSLPPDEPPILDDLCRTLAASIALHLSI